MEQIGVYTQTEPFTTARAGTAEWCKAEYDGRQYFVKKFQSPVYPQKSIGLQEKIYLAMTEEYKETLAEKNRIYQALRESDTSGFLVVPLEVISYQFHICTIAEYIIGNVTADQVCSLSEWQRLILMRTLTAALMNVHKAGVVHSDMKLDNVIITQDENGHCRLRLIDFDGSFFESNPPDDPEEIVGDPAFFSPEAYLQSMGEDVTIDHRIDIFALGIIFHYFWCGRFPVKPADQTLGEYLLCDGQIVTDTTVPPDLKQLIQEMLCVNPDGRPGLSRVYEVLGIQMERCKKEIILLHSSEKTETSSDSGKEAVVAIYCRVVGGKLLSHYSVTIPYNTKTIIEAEEIKGYVISGSKTEEIEVHSDESGSAKITFYYMTRIDDEPSSDRGTAVKLRRILLILLSVFLLYWANMYLLSMYTYLAGDYEKASALMGSTPFFERMNPAEYQMTMDMLEYEGSLTESNE